MNASPRSPYDTGTEKLLLTVDDGIARVTFNNPGKHNALSTEMSAALPPLLEFLQADPEVRVVVLTGAGSKAFVSGADISEFAERRTTPEARVEYDRAMADAGRAWISLQKPIIAMIRGYCIGGGLVTALQADIRIASDDGQFAIPAARLGLGYSYEAVETLMSAVGPAWTAEMLFSARRLSAAEAVQIGLVNRVTPAEQLEAEVMDLARTIAQNAPLTVVACKAAIREARRAPDRRTLDRVAQLVEACFRSEDYLEGQRAFHERRSPRFTGH
jgi:enoyl-CoA hydratase